jgi:hypothetical protein
VARGWESKAVEAQQAEAEQKPAGHQMSKEEAARFRERESLRLARKQVLHQIEASANPKHRKLLEDTLAELDGKLKD